MVLKKTIYALLIILIGFAIYKFYEFANSDFGGSKECGWAMGPFYGEKIQIKLDTIKVEQYIDFPDGRFAVTNMEDELSPILIKLNEDSKVIWAIKFDLGTGINMNKITTMELNERDGEKSLDFFNMSYGEPATIYLTDNYDVAYVCISAM